MSGGQLSNTLLAVIFVTLYFAFLILVLLAAYYFSMKVNASGTLNIEQDGATADHNESGTTPRLISTNPDPIIEPEYAEVRNLVEEPKRQPVAEPEYAMVNKAKKKSKKKTSGVNTDFGECSLAQDTEISEYDTIQY